MEKTIIIAEAGVNHNGCIERAMRLVDVAVESGADVVKFQTFRTEHVVSRFAPKAEYQTKTTSCEESQFEMVKKLELDEAAHQLLIEYCRKSNIQFLSTPFDLYSVDLLARTFDLPYLKISSGEITNAPLLVRAAQTGKKVLLSTGMSTIAEIERALGCLAFGYLPHIKTPSQVTFLEAYCSEVGQRVLKEMVTLLHCTTEYPAPFVDINLKAMDTIRFAFGLPVGFSDHSQGIAIPIAAVARGAVVIEKHFTLDKSLPGPDHQASLEPEELKEMVRSIRQVEAALGNERKIPAISEIKNIAIARKSLVAAKQILKGELFTEENVACKRPGNGISPMNFWELLGEKAGRDFRQDELLD